MVKVTFTLDDASVAELAESAERKRIPKSQALREAIHDYAAKAKPLADRMSEAERLRKLQVLDETMKRPPTRTQKEVDREIAEIRRARRTAPSVRLSDRPRYVGRDRQLHGTKAVGARAPQC